jgi:cytochrome c
VSDAQAEAAPAYAGDRVGHYGLGAPATPAQIAGWDIDIRPDGLGLPEGSGSVEDGEWLYEEKCAECHGSFGEGVGRYPVLAGGEGTLRDARPTRTVGSYWPYASTLFDYIRRTMPFTQPESLSADETYAITAYVLYLNDLVADDLVLGPGNLASIRMPNEANFVPDPRPDVSNTRCMQNCRDPQQIQILSEVVPAAAVEAPSARPAVAEAEHPGQATYEQYCSICHKVGVGGAPVLGNAAQWTERIAGGLDAMVANAIDGVASDKGVMPAKGGFSHLSDAQVTDAVRYMMEKSS